MTTPTRRVAPVLASLLTAVLVGGLGGCGTAPSSVGLCDRYAELKTSVQQLRASTAPSVTVEQLRADADRLRQQVDKLADALDRIQMMSDGRLDSAIGQARQQLDEIRAQLVVAKYQAAETLGPQLTQAQDDLRAALAPVQQLLDSQCSAG
jgi:chromosome segregation ATPase